MQVKVFHPYFNSSVFCKEKLKKFTNYDVKIYQENKFDYNLEIKDLHKYNKFVIIVPIWWYSFPYNFIKWAQMLNENKNIFKDKKVHLIIMTGGEQHRYKEDSKTGIKNMNKWIDEFFFNPIWEIYYNCIPKNIDHLRAVWFKKWEFEKGYNGND